MRMCLFEHILQRISVIFFHGIEAGTGLLRIEVAMPYDQGTRVTLTQRFDQSPHGCLLFSRARVGGLTSDVEPALIADADRVGIVVQAVSTHHPFRTAWLDRSVTTDHVVVADA